MTRMVLMKNSFYKNYSLCGDLLLKHIIKYALILLSLQMLEVYGQSSTMKFWNLKYIKGSATFSGNYSYQYFMGKNAHVEELDSKLFRGIFELSAETFILHPNFILIDTELSYRPGTESNEYIIIPTRTQNTNSEKFHTSLYLFKKRPYNASFYLNIDHSFINRDYTSNSELFRNSTGVVINATNKILPFRIKYDYDNWIQKEIQINREFKNRNNNLNLFTSLALFGALQNRLNINYSNFSRTYSLSNAEINSNNFETSLSSSGSFETPLKIGINSRMDYLNRAGFDASSRIQIYENINFYLPSNVTVTTNLLANSAKYKALNSKQFNFDLGAKHKLYESLFSNASFSITESKQNSSIEKINRQSLGINYVKNIPTGKLTISFNLDRENKASSSNISHNFIRDENHILDDQSIILLVNPNVDVNSIIVKSSDGLIIYRRDIDYQIIRREQYIEIRRTLGGQISDGEKVLVDYITTIDPSFQYTSLNQNFFISLNLFENFIEISYSNSNLKFFEKYNVDNIALREIDRDQYSIKLRYKGFSSGAERDDFKSNIIPYLSDRYFIEYGYWKEGKALISLSANYRKFFFISENLTQNFIDVVTKISYMLSFYSKLNFEASYRMQEGKGIDLSLSTGKIELLTIYRSIDVILGGEFFVRNYLGEINNYFNTYIKLKRNF